MEERILSIFVQHGYGKTNKIERGLDSRSVDGLIVSPRDERPEAIRQLVEYARNHDCHPTVMMDPQFYASTVINARDGYLSRYPYYHSELTRARFSPNEVKQYVTETLDFQRSLGVTHLVSPTVLVRSFEDIWSQIAISLGQESMQYHLASTDPRPLLVSLVVSQDALENREALEDYLDTLTSLDVAGFYLVVEQMAQTLEEAQLTNLLYLVFVLGSLNQFKVLCGYADWIGVVLHAVGAQATATGWHGSLRRFSLSRFRPATGGRQPRPRYSSGPLLSSVLVIPELSAIFQLGYLERVLSKTNYDSLMTRGPANASWPADVSCLHHWEVLASLSQTMSSLPTDLALDRCVTLIDEAKDTYDALVESGIPFETDSGRTLEVWKRSIETFRKEVGI